MIQRAQINKHFKQIVIKKSSKNTIVPYKPTEHENNVIPLTIYQTWHTKILSSGMQNSIELIKRVNPEFTHELFDDEDCSNFIEMNFPKEVFDAFNSLIPGAYKADLWRYCILYKRGGIYLDIKYKPVNNFKFIAMTKKEHWVLDMDGIGIYNALMICKAGNPILLGAINKIVENVQSKYYGSNPLEPTGPLLLSNFFTQNQKSKFTLSHDFIFNFDNRFIYFNKFAILRSYTGYIKDHAIGAKKIHYSNLWHEKQIYNII